MVRSVIDDIKDQFRYGNKITQLILINFFVFLAILIGRIITLGIGDTPLYTEMLSWIALPSSFWELIKKPWTLLTHMFVHEGIWHLAWNMILLYWIGRIFGDLLGDKKVVPLYIAGGLFGALFFLLTAFLSPSIGGIAYGASAAVTAFVVASAWVAPDYSIRLLLLGDVKLKYIAMAIVLFNFIDISNGTNVGGNIAHLGGAIFGGVYVYLLQRGVDILDFSRRRSAPPQRKAPQKKAPMKVVHSIYQQKNQNPVDKVDLQDQVDAILDKINASGYDSLTAEEKEILYQASKN